MDERHRYVTRAAHGKHAIGEMCWVTFVENGRLARLEYDGGEVIELPRYQWRFPGIDPLTLAEQIDKEIDEDILKSIEGT